MAARFVYITARDRDEALALGRLLVEERLAACANILPQMTSLYWWNGELTEDREAVLIAKTTDERIEALIERVRERHSYECPCIVSWPIDRGNKAYLEWLVGQTQQNGSG